MILPYFTLLATAFLAATILPLSSEALLGAMLLSSEYALWGLWLAATVGNVAGSLFNGWLGRYCLHWQHKRWFPFKEEGLERARARFQRYGIWSLLLAWVPVIGDPITFVAGLMRTPWGLFVLLVTLGKGGRYGAVILLLAP
ncbi:MAG: DedA family protein [Magnetococcales bacterium]|nr:DedA family protein [Magnetococcales bacterium]